MNIAKVEQELERTENDFLNGTMTAFGFAYPLAYGLSYSSQVHNSKRSSLN